jgi:hypothetical protein
MLRETKTTLRETKTTLRETKTTLRETKTTLRFTIHYSVKKVFLHFLSPQPPNEFGV